MPISGVQRVVQKLKGKTVKNAAVRVGYSAPYAMRIHEDLNMRHPNGGQAKFLEQPARTQKPQMQRIITDGIKRGLSLEEALLLAGEYLLQESQKLVPVDTGF